MVPIVVVCIKTLGFLVLLVLGGLLNGTDGTRNVLLVCVVRSLWLAITSSVPLYSSGLVYFPIVVNMIVEVVFKVKALSRLWRTALFIVLSICTVPLACKHSDRPMECILVNAFSGISFIGCWLMSDRDGLLELERRIIGLTLPPHLEASISRVAGLGTVVIKHKEQTESPRKVIILVHGYGGGNALWVKSFEQLASRYDVYCVELPGMGASDRPDWIAWEPKQVFECFQDSLELWRHSMGLSKFDVLLGHSLGALAVSAYAVRHASRVVEHLFLVSPVGVANRDSSKTATRGPSLMLTGSFPARLACWMVSIPSVSLISPHVYVYTNASVIPPDSLVGTTLGSFRHSPRPRSLWSISYPCDHCV